jgi:glycosyltransferase involved in cell wall biosynthesis
MKILILSTFERKGGAAIAANRLMHALNKAGQEAKMLVRDKQTDDPNVVTVNTNRWKRKINFIRFALERWIIFSHNRFSRKNLFAVSIANTGTDLSRHPLVQEADILNLHWINQGFLSLKNIRRLIRTGKTIVWTLQDQWSISGICHYTGECKKYTIQCTRCPLLTRPGKTDLACQTFQKKKKLLGHANIHLVGSSRWITETARQTALYPHATCHTIPCPVDQTTFFPRNKAHCRTTFNLPDNKKLILFAAAKLSDSRKGMSYFIEACHFLEQEGNIELVFLGSNPDKHSLAAIPIPTHLLGYLSTSAELSMIYTACDLFVIPSLEDNLPNTVLEAMACGTPCVGFHAGGIPEMIDHQVNGYLAAYKSSKDLATGINWCLAPENRDRLSKHALLKVQTCYTENIVAQQYIEYYKNAISRQKKRTPDEHL